MDYDVRWLPDRLLLVTGSTQQVLLSPKDELLLTLPRRVRELVERIPGFQPGGQTLPGERIPAG
jgi:hypothetical protein